MRATCTHANRFMRVVQYFAYPYSRVVPLRMQATRTRMILRSFLSSTIPAHFDRSPQCVWIDSRIIDSRSRLDDPSFREYISGLPTRIPGAETTSRKLSDGLLLPPCQTCFSSSRRSSTRGVLWLSRATAAEAKTASTKVAIAAIR